MSQNDLGAPCCVVSPNNHFGLKPSTSTRTYVHVDDVATSSRFSRFPVFSVSVRTQQGNHEIIGCFGAS